MQHHARAVFTDAEHYRLLPEATNSDANMVRVNCVSLCFGNLVRSKGSLQLEAGVCVKRCKRHWLTKENHPQAEPKKSIQRQSELFLAESHLNDTQGSRFQEPGPIEFSLHGQLSPDSGRALRLQQSFATSHSKCWL